MLGEPSRMLFFRRLPWWTTDRPQLSTRLERHRPHMLSDVSFPSHLRARQGLTLGRRNRNWTPRLAVDPMHRSLCASHPALPLVPSPMPVVPHVLVNQTIYTMGLRRRGESSETSETSESSESSESSQHKGKILGLVALA